MPKFIIKISSPDKTLVNNQDICCYLADESSAPEALQAAISSDKLVLATGEDAINFCLKKNLDGVLTSHLVDEKYGKYIKSLQKELGGRKFWGAEINPSRHEAMIASEEEPEFVAFRVTKDSEAIAAEILDWYGELFLIQSALFYSSEISQELLEKTDFLILNTDEYKILVDKMKRLD